MFCLFPLFDGWLEGIKWRSSLQHVFMHYVFETFQWVSDSTVNPLKMVNVCMYLLCPLLPHQSWTNPPTFHPGEDMIFQEVHLWDDASVREWCAVVFHKLRYTALCKQRKHILTACTIMFYKKLLLPSWVMSSWVTIFLLYILWHSANSWRDLLNNATMSLVVCSILSPLPWLSLSNSPLRCSMLLCCMK